MLTITEALWQKQDKKAGSLPGRRVEAISGNVDNPVRPATLPALK